MPGLQFQVDLSPPQADSPLLGMWVIRRSWANQSRASNALLVLPSSELMNRK